jgi:hypothetical protein
MSGDSSILRRQYRPYRLFVHEYGCMAALISRPPISVLVAPTEPSGEIGAPASIFDGPIFNNPVGLRWRDRPSLLLPSRRVAGRMKWRAMGMPGSRKMVLISMSLVPSAA